MRRALPIGLLIGLVLSSAGGFVAGVSASTNWYEYHVLEGNEEPDALVNRGGWQPGPGSFGDR